MDRLNKEGREIEFLKKAKTSLAKDRKGVKRKGKGTVKKMRKC